MAQQPVKNYEKEWKKVDDLVNKKLPQSALAEVKKIYTLAKKDKQDAQIIKALVYMTGLQGETREDNEIFSIQEIEKEIAVSKEPAISILKSISAEQYQTYSRYRFGYRRYRPSAPTRTENFVKKDIKTWGEEDFNEKISQLYLESIQNEKTLQKIRLESFDAIIGKGNVRHLRPTLYDLLAFRATSFFENPIRYLTKPSYAFEIDQAAAFDPAMDFTKVKFTTRDTQSLHYKALLIYQKIISFHLKDVKPDALIDADLHRLAFIKNNSTHPDKDQLYFNAINHIAQQYQNLPAASQAWYLLADYYNSKADSYQPYGDTTQRLARIKAREICENVLQQKDSSEGKINCYNLLQNINKRSLSFFIEKVNTPGEPFRTLIQYKNFNTLYLRLLKVDDKLREQLSNRNDENYWSVIRSANPLKSWQQVLPETNDLQQHSTEIKIDGLPVGEYMLVAGTAIDFQDKNTILGARVFYISNISYVNNDRSYFILHRNSGQPIAAASVQLWKRNYNPAISKYVMEKYTRYKTDTNGFFQVSFPPGEPYGGHNYQLEITTDGDRLYMDDYVYDYYYYPGNGNEKEVDKAVTSIYFFTDRSIYRPGQAVYFKGIVLTGNTSKKTATPNAGYKTVVYLQDANYQDIDSITFTTNEYGSFSGKFQLPQTGLNGQFGIVTKKDPARVSFNVEEYKRPKFYVEYEPIKGTYKVNDKIQITGVAKAYAGNNIDGAIVKYRVVRKARFLYPWMFWRSWLPPVKEMEITHGEIKTDKDGKFLIDFFAIPDLSIDKKTEPVFDYIVYADVTDINGETRSGEKQVSVSYKALMLQTDIPSVLPADSLKSLSIRTQNMNGEFEPSAVLVRITRLKEEKRLIRERYWQRPDQFIMSKQEYIQYFPHDEYDNESDFKSWEKGNKVFEGSDSSRENGEWKVANGKWEAGFYVIEISAKGKNGDEIKDVRYIELFDEKSNQLNRPDYLWREIKQITIEPGQTAKIEIGTAADNLFIVQQIDKTTNSQFPATHYSYTKLDTQKQTFSFPATEADRGGYGVTWLFVKHNRFHRYTQVINVPWTNKDLAIEYATYRDKTLPGSEERWKVKITGYKKEKVAAEMLASMYDASLDQFKNHQWYKPFVWPNYSFSNGWNDAHNFSDLQSILKSSPIHHKGLEKNYDGLFINSYGEGSYMYGDALNLGPRLMRLAKPVFKSEAEAEVAMAAGVPLPDSDGDGTIDQFDLVQNTPEEAAELKKQKEAQRKKTESEEVTTRKNFNETAFFFPDLKTDSEGNIEFSFTMPEAMTKWKFQALAHTKDLSFGYSSKEIITQKELMVQPNAPRFLREGDRMELSSKIVNLTDKEITGQVHLQLFDAATNEPVDGHFHSSFPNQYFTVAAGQSEAVKFPVEVPYQFNKALLWRIVARAGNYSDGEENTLPVLTNRMLVTETLPLNVRGTGTKNFSFDKLLNAGKSESLQHHALTVEYTSNPAWYAVQALPYLMEYPYDCAEQTWNRYYANSLASMIANSSPKIKQVFEQWKIKDTAALMSNLQKNQELKAVLLEETPWVLQAKNEAEQKKNIALLFDMVKMSEQLNSSLEKLKQSQLSNGGFVWFKGGPDDRYITQYIITGIGHLKKLNAYAPGQEKRLNEILNLAIPYLDKKIKEDYDALKKTKTDLKKYTPGHTEIQYLYMRSFFPEYAVDKNSVTAYNYFRERAQKTWTTQSKYMQGMIALSLYRTKDEKTPAAILKSLKETSITNEELGMYWKSPGSGGWFWYQAPIETQSLLIEVFSEVGNDSKAVDDLKTWLLKNKQTNNWRTTKATAEACYALLLQGTQWITNEPAVEIKLGSTLFHSEKETEAGTGYFKKLIPGEKVNPNMGTIAVTVTPASTPQPLNSSTSWGSVYWQYFEDLDKITTASSPLKLEKKLFVEKNTDRGPVLSPVNEGEALKIGDKIKVRVELRVDRDMEYVHMKDMRASALEPTNVLSSYKWQGGLGYYESTKDASTNFFFSYLRKGTYVFEYALFVTNTGNFSNGLTTIQCMYAPEFTAHSEGIRITVE